MALEQKCSGRLSHFAEQKAVSSQPCVEDDSFKVCVCVCVQESLLYFFFQPLRLSCICGVDEKGRGQKVAVSHLIAIVCVIGVFAMFYQRGAKLFCPGFRDR